MNFFVDLIYSVLKEAERVRKLLDKHLNLLEKNNILLDSILITHDAVLQLGGPVELIIDLDQHPDVEAEVFKPLVGVVARHLERVLGWLVGQSADALWAREVDLSVEDKIIIALNCNIEREPLVLNGEGH